MSNRFRVVLGLAALAAFGALPSAGFAGGGATTIKNVTCPMYDGYGVKFTAYGTTTVSSDGTRAKLTCSAKGVPTPSSSTIYWNYANTGGACQVIGKLTNDWQESVTSRGTASMTCNLTVQ
jgi:hypothetical protein